MRTIIVSDNGGATLKKVESSATTWADVQSDLAANGINVSGKKAIVGNTNTTLELPEAQLPSGNFTLFLMPVQVKAGAMSYAEAKTFLKEKRMKAVENEDEDLVEIIGNYTRDTTETLNEKVERVNNYLNPSQNTHSNELDESMENRLFEVEFRLGIINPENETRTQERFMERAKQISKSISSLGK